MTNITAKMNAEIRNHGLVRKLRQASFHRLASSDALPGAGSVGSYCASTSSLITNPWIEIGVDNVNDEIDYNEKDHQDRDDANDYGALLLLDGLEYLLANTRQVKDGLCDNRTTNHGGKVCSDQWQHGNEGVAQR